MKILFTTVRFYPSHGGVQTVTRLFADALTRLGHSVRVVTREPADRPDEFPYAVVRRPSAARLVGEFLRSEAVVLHGPSVAIGWPVLVVRRPTTVIHYMPESPAVGRRRAAAVIRREIARRCRHLSVSEGFRPSGPHPYQPAIMPIDTDFFRTLPGVPRDRDIVFLGRLVPLKGVHDLLDAIIALNAQGQRYTATVIGDGPERDELAAKIRGRGLADQVELAGPLEGEELVRRMNRHRVVAVPSRYDEPFGLVAVEGIACGCVAVGTAGGGLPGAVGPCGTTVPNGDVPALAAAINRLLGTPGELDHYRAAAPAHVSRFTPQAAAEHLLRLMAK